jgi:D-threo-aldose 1-dehydrogenase
MSSRRNFIGKSILATTVAGMAPMVSSLSTSAGYSPYKKLSKHYRPPHTFGLGGVAIGNGFRPTTDDQAQEALEGAWAAGVRFFLV